MIVATRIPTHRNDGSKIGVRELKAILKRVRLAFRGYSFDAPAEGAWVSDDGKVYEERSSRLEVVVPRDRVKEVKEMFKSIGLQLGQRAIYFEVREGGEIIDLE